MAKKKKSQSKAVKKKATKKVKKTTSIKATTKSATKKTKTAKPRRKTQTKVTPKKRSARHTVSPSAADGKPAAEELHSRTAIINPAEYEVTIRTLAYAKWESAGCPNGDGVEFWLAAEREIDAQSQGVE